MSLPQLIKEISVESYQIRLFLEEERPLAEYRGEIFNHIWLLTQQVSSLSNPSYLKEFAEISNFLWKGVHFQFIDQIADYQKFYTQQVEIERKHPSDVFPYRLTDYQIFDVSCMHDPRLEGESLSYFVRQTATGLPYRVVCPFPYTLTNSVVHYQILPIKS